MTYSDVTFARPVSRDTPNAALTGSNIDSPPLAAMFSFCALFYLSIYTVEAPVRYMLYLGGFDSFILIRDSLMILPLGALFAWQARSLKLHVAYVAAILVIGFHGLILVGTTGSLLGVVYGAKILMNLLFGFFAASLLIAPTRRGLLVLAILWLIILVGVTLDKFFVSFPWTGIKTVIGDLNVDVSKDWQIQDGFAKRVAGFTRSSIAVAAILPCLTIVLMGRLRRYPQLRAVIALLGIGGVFLTTQKGSLIAMIPVMAILCGEETKRQARMRFCALIFLLIAVGLPLLAVGLHMEHGAGVFSTESLYLRVADTWPDAWRWIGRHQMLVFGVGVGGIGGPQRLYAPDNFNPADNLFVLLYAYFGVFAILYGMIVAVLMNRPVTGSQERVESALAVIAFAIGYGAVLSIIEDQSASLFLGAAIGVLWRETATNGQPALRYRAARRW